ncbi:aromatic amino acid lyase [Saccharothrix sp. AJ9571]|nr:aromatic amino acid lyase [Saccharothrix sp. AJ9571]
MISAPEELDAAAILAVAEGKRVELAPELLASVAANRVLVLDALTAAARPVYGVNTGMGRMVDVVLSAEEQATHQSRLLIGRAVGGPPWLPERDVRAVFAVRLRGMLLPSTGASAEAVSFLVDRLGDGFVPAVPREGIGCAGEIIPLSHAFQTFLGIGRMLDGQSAAEALEVRGAEPYVPGPKEGLTFIQGAPIATAHAILRGAEANQVVDLVAAAQFPGRPGAVQPPVSVRVGARATAHARRVLAELADEVERAFAVTDSPAFLDGEFFSTDAFHAADLGLRMDAVSAALAHLGEISVQRLHRLLDERFSGLNPQLAVVPGPQTGLTPLHKRAVGELHALRRLATPATLGSIDTSNGQEDVQAFACAAGEQLREAVERLLTITVCEHIGLAQAAFLRGEPTALIEPLTEDRPLGPEIERLVRRWSPWRDWADRSFA